MNIPDIDWEENTITGNQYKKVINEVLKSTIDDVGLEQVEDKHTGYFCNRQTIPSNNMQTNKRG
jgi:beta-xylosidase